EADATGKASARLLPNPSAVASLPGAVTMSLSNLAPLSPVLGGEGARGAKAPGNFLMSIDLAIVPVAGQGTRLLPSTKSQPKEMLPVGRKPVVQYVIEELALSGIRRLLFVTGPGKTSIENHFDTNVELIAFLRETGKE